MSTKPTNNKNALSEYYFNLILRYQRTFLSVLLIVLWSIPLLSNYLEEKPLLIGGESYYYLSSAQQELPYHPFSLLLKIIPDQAALLIPLLISLGILLLFYLLAEKMRLSQKKKFFLGLFYILTPTFIFTSLTFSSYSLFIFLILLGTNLLLQDSRKKYFSIFPFLTASLMDTFSGLVLLIGITIYSYATKKSKDRYHIALIIGISALIVLNAVLFKAPFILGPFHVQNKAADLVSDLGSLHGVGVFMILLAAIGIITNWQKKNLVILISSLTIALTAYLLNTYTMYFFAVFIISVAALGFVDLLEQDWKLPFLRNAVILLLLLGISFSTVSYYDRLAEYAPTAIDQKALEWISRNTDPNTVVLSAPENSYYISYFAERESVFSLHQNYRKEYTLSQNIFSAFYIDELFPLLEENKVSVIYVSEDMKEELPPQQEFLFLLQNERFKLLYFTGNAEVWAFDEARQ